MNRIFTRLDYLRQAIRLVWESARWWTLLQAGIIVLQGLLPIAMLYLTKRVVDAAGAFLAQAPGEREVLALWTLGPWLVLVVVAGWICRALSSVVAGAQSDAVADHIQDTLQEKSVEIDLSYYESSAYYDQIRMAQAEAISRPAIIVQNLVRLSVGAVSLIAIAWVIGIEQGLLLPVMLVAAIPGSVARIWNSQRRNHWRVKNAMAERYTHYLHMLLTALPFAKEIRLNDSGNELRRQYREKRHELRSGRLALMRRRAGIELSADIMSAIAVAVGLGLVYLRMRDGNMSLGDLALLYGGFQRGKGAFSGVLGSIAGLYEDALFIGHYYEFMALPCSVRSPSTPKPVPKRINRAIRFEKVSFRYPGTETDVLRDINLEIKAGEHMALVGENGSGKSTLVKLLCRLYDPTKGKITIDGTDIREFSLKDLRASYGVLFQDFVRYQMTVGENIRMGDVKTLPGDERIEQAARKAGAEKMIGGMKFGYNTPLGRMFGEDGSEPSEGQWQRIALARTFLRQAPVVILDEPSSALDAKAERELIAEIMKAFSGKTAIVVSHRFTTVESADRIAVLSEGCLVECGNHKELAAERGVYAGLFALHNSKSVKR